MNQVEAVKRLTEIACEEFIQHWQVVAARISAGEDLAAWRSDFLLAGSASGKLRMAKLLYNAKHVKFLSSLNASAIAQQLEPWLGAAIAQAIAETTSDLPVSLEDHRIFFRALVRAEYVILVTDAEKPSRVCPLPDERVEHSNIFLISAAGDSWLGAEFVVYKSTGEEFSAMERRSAIPGIENDFYGNADVNWDEREVWTLLHEPVSDPRAVEVCVYDHTVGEDEHGFPILGPLVEEENDVKVLH